MTSSLSMLLLALAGGLPSAPPAPYAPTLDGPPLEPGREPPASLRSPSDPPRVGPPLEVPWSCGQTEYCTQGHNGGSHTGTSSWAWDFALQEGEEIWAASAGVVTHLRMSMTDGGCDSAFSGSANYITIDNGDGTSTAYLHMLPNTSPLSVGDLVEVGDLVARVGATGYACGAHLHMQVQEACGAYYCQSVQASFADYGDPSASVQYDGTNCPACPLVLDGTQTIVDDEDAGCLVRQTTAWWSSYEGHGDHHFWTRAIAAAGSDSSARWRFGVSVPGDYEVEAFVPEADASTTHAAYQVHHEGGTTEIVLDQSTQKGWQPLGTFSFVGGDGEGVELGDATGEDVGQDRHVAFDAIRLTYVPAAGDTGSAETGSMGEGGTGEASGGGEGTPDGTGGGGTVGSSGAGGSGLDPDDGPGMGTDDDALPPGFGEGQQGAGCACRSRGGAPAWAPGALVVLVVLARARRRRPSRP